MKHTARSRYILAVALLTAMVLTERSTASSSTLAWDPPVLNTDGTPVTNLAGYVIFYGTESGVYSSSIDVGNVTSYTLTGLEDAQVYYASVKAYNTYDLQSDTSVELVWTAPDGIPPDIAVPDQLTLTGDDNDEAEIPDLIAMASITDNVSDRSNISITQTPAAGTIVGIGTVPVTLTATDEAGNTAQATVNIMVAAVNRPPVISAGSDQSTTLPRKRVNLEGTATDDGLPEGSVVTFEWSVVSGPAAVTFDDATASSATATFSVEGIYVLRLSVTDGELTVTDDVTITVYPKPVPMPPSNLHATLK